MPDPSPTSRTTLLRGGTVIDGTGIDGTGTPAFKGDLLIRGGRIAAVGPEAEAVASIEAADETVDCSGRILLPGFVDAHSHAEAQVFDDEVALALLRQGVTSVITGQDGVSFAPGDGAYATAYFGAINGRHPTFTGGGVADLLRTYARSTPINVGYLVPAGTVRAEVCGLGPAAPTPDQLAAMTALVAAGLAEGAFGLSTGLDYAPGLFAGTAEITALCRPVAAVGAVYVSHMRGGYEDNAAAGVEEVVAICRDAGVAGHISHFHARADLVRGLVDAARAAGVDLTYDSYPYARGCTVLAMLALPPELLERGVAACVAELQRPDVRASLAARLGPHLSARPDLGPGWADQITIAHVADHRYDDLPGATLAEAAARRATDPAALAVQVLADAALQVSVLMRVPGERGDDELAANLGHPAQMGGSDGIFLGRAPHPRGWGTFARYVATFALERGDLTLEQVAHTFAHRPARRFGLGSRGSLRPGAVADLIVLDPARAAVRADYGDARRPAEGIDDVFVNGGRVLAEGRLTGLRSGVGLHRKRARAGV